MRIVVAFTKYIRFNIGTQTEKVAIVKNAASYKFFDCRSINTSCHFCLKPGAKSYFGPKWFCRYKVTKNYAKKVRIVLIFCFFITNFPQNYRFDPLEFHPHVPLKKCFEQKYFLPKLEHKSS